MSEEFRLVLQFVVMAGVITAFSNVGARARERSRGEWLSLVGRPPRDLYADRRVNLVANLIHEWGWIGFTVMLAGYVMYVPDSTSGIATYVIWLGIGMMVVNAVGRALCILCAKLAPQYEAQAARAVVANAEEGAA